MLKILMVYGSSEGQTAKIARHIADVLTENGHSVRSIEGHELPDDLSLAQFDGVLVGASVHAGKHDKRIVAFVKANLAALEQIPSAFFSVSLTAASSNDKDRADVERLLDQFSQRTGWHPEKMGVFAGALMYTQYSPLIRFVMKRISGTYGGETDTSRDHEYTDWDGVTQFAETFLATLPDRATP